MKRLANHCTSLHRSEEGTSLKDNAIERNATKKLLFKLKLVGNDIVARPVGLALTLFRQRWIIL